MRDITLTTRLKTLGITIILLFYGCTGTGLEPFGFGDLYFKAGRDSAGHPESKGLLDTAMGSLTYNGKSFTPAEEERVQKALSELQDGETITWENPNFGKMVFGPPKMESDFWDPDRRWRSTWQNKEGLTCRDYELRYIGRALGIHWITRSHHACLKNKRWIPGSPDRVSTS